MADTVSVPPSSPLSRQKDIRGHHISPRGPSRERRAHRAALFFILPALLGFGVFYLWPTIRGVYLSFTDYSLLAPPEWAGLANYIKLIGDGNFWYSLAVTLEYVVINIGVQTIVAILLAVLMHRLTKSSLLRGVLLLPYLVANVVVALVWYWMADYTLGVVNQVIGWIGLGPFGFFGEEHLVIPTIALVNVWRHMGYTALLIFAGLQAIPRSLYEAAAVDGSSEWRSFWRITLPLLRPVLAMVLVITVIGSFQIFDTVAVTTQGGPADASKVVYYYIFEKAFSQFDFGYASAMGVALIVILAGVSMFQLRMLRAGESDLS